MQTDVSNQRVPLAIRLVLRRQEMAAEGRRDAFAFVRECQGDIAAIQEKIVMYEYLLSDPSTTAKGQPYAPNTTVSEHADGYLAGLKDALHILQANGKASPEEPLRKAHAPRKAVAEKSTRYTARKPAARRRKP